MQQTGTKELAWLGGESDLQEIVQGYTHKPKYVVENEIHKISGTLRYKRIT